MSSKTQLSFVALALAFCASSPIAASPLPTDTRSLQAQATVALSESDQAIQLFDAIYMEEVMANPILQTFMGIKQDYGKWDDLSEQAESEKLARNKRHLAQVMQLDASKLDAQTKLSLELITQRLQDAIKDYHWRLYNYPVNQILGVHSMIPAILINQHQISNVSDAEAYISRLNGIPQRLQQLQQGLTLRAEHGIIAPKFVFAHVQSDCQNIISGAPFNTGNLANDKAANNKETGKDSALLADFSRKVNALAITAAEKTALIAKANTALLEQVGPAYKALMAYLTTLAAKADDRAGAWKFPDGEAFYQRALASTTTTNMSADAIHQLGLAEVKRIHNEMHAIMQQVHFDGTLQQFFAFMRDDPQFYYPNTEAGKAAYLAKAQTTIDNMRARLNEVFESQPKSPIIVKRVEAFREKSAAKAFYEPPSADGSRPGTFYANLHDMRNMPTYQLEALVYHEGIPGHHMQVALAQELHGLPKFRKYFTFDTYRGSIGYTAYTEGWGLYSEAFPKEMGFYADPYSNFGRLAMELWRACRLVVDTGIHAKHWTRDEAIAYYEANTPNAKADDIKMVERHIVLPGQATAYKVGMNKIMQLKQKAQAELGSQFDIRAFHTVLLANGALPLDVLAQQVDAYIAQVKKEKS